MKFDQIFTDPAVSTAMATWALVLFTALLCTGVVIGLIQISLLKKQIHAEHELGRRTRAIDDLHIFSQSLDREHPSARRLVDDFSDKQIAALVNRTPVYLSNDCLGLLEYALSGLGPECKFEKTENGLLLNEKHLSHLLQLCCGHLNRLEIALQGWFNGIADAKIIEEQLKYVVSDKRGHYILEKFRKHDVVKGNYPAIAAFVSKIRTDIKGEKPRDAVL